MKHKVIFKQQMILNIVIFLIVIVSVGRSIQSFEKEDQVLYYNRARLLIADQLKELEQGYYPKGEYPYTVLDLSGKVLYTSDEEKYSIGDQVNVTEELQFDQNFNKENKEYLKIVFPLYQMRKVDRFVVLSIRQSLLMEYSGVARIIYIFSPIIYGILLILVLLILRCIYIKRHILNPISEINQSAKAIIEGNYDIPVVKSNGKRLLHSEMDELTFGFELMRDELKEKRIKEEALKRSQKELISCISHDLKTPLSTIKAYSEGLRDGIAKDEEKQKRYAEIIANKAEVLTKMMNDLLEHSNAELNELKMVKKECYFGSSFHKTMKEVKLLLERQGIVLEYNQDIPNVIVLMDEGRINQVIYNLVENALKYMDKDKGKIRITTTYLNEEKKISISIKDNGSGISMSDIPYVFDKFYRAEKSRNMSIPGSGLGLSICKYIIEEHGGSIACHSKLGEGTQFVYTIALSS